MPAVAIHPVTALDAARFNPRDHSPLCPLASVAGSAKFNRMARSHDSEYLRALQEAVEEVGVYPLEAFEFVQQGLSYAVGKRYGANHASTGPAHVTGQELCEGLREYAQMQWGM